MNFWTASEVKATVSSSAEMPVRSGGPGSSINLEEAMTSWKTIACAVPPSSANCSSRNQRISVPASGCSMHASVEIWHLHSLQHAITTFSSDRIELTPMMATLWTSYKPPLRSRDRCGTTHPIKGPSEVWRAGTLSQSVFPTGSCVKDFVGFKDKSVESFNACSISGKALQISVASKAVTSQPCIPLNCTRTMFICTTSP